MGSVNLTGGGLDVQGIVDNLILVERQPIDRIQAQSKTSQNKISAYQALNTKLLALKTTVEGMLFNSDDVPLGMPASFSERLNQSVLALRKATSSDENVVKATAGKGQAAGSYAVTVTQLATFNSHASNNFTSDTGIRTKYGTLSITKGSETQQDIAITTDNNTLQGIRDAINAKNAGFTASIVNDGSGTPYRLAITSNDSGTANQLIITNNLSTDPDNNLAAITFGETKVAKNALLQVNGVDIQSSSNSVSTAVDGVTLDLRAEGQSAVVSVERDSDAVVAKIKDFVAKYNDTVTYLAAQSRYDTTQKKAGILAGDFTLRDAQSQISTVLAQSVDSGGTMKVMAQAGIKLTNSGTLSFDESVFRDKLSTNFVDTARLFLADGLNTSGDAASMIPLMRSRLKNITDAYQGPVFHAIDTQQQNIRRIDQQVLQMESRLESRRAILLAQFTRADEALKQLAVLQSSMTSLTNTLGKY